MMRDKHTCGRCSMGFHIVDRFNPQTEVSRCGEHGCGMRMASGGGDGTVRMYVERKTVEERNG